MPNDIVGETNDFVARSFGHFGESFGLSLVFKGITGEVDAFGAGLVSNQIQS